MKTIELSEAKARALIKYLAPRWADIAMRIVATNAPVNTPYRAGGETMKSRTFLARVKRRREEMVALGELLVGLGARLPIPDRDQVVSMYSSPRAGVRPAEQWRGAPATDRERARLIEAICTSI